MPEINFRGQNPKCHPCSKNEPCRLADPGGRPTNSGLCDGWKASCRASKTLRVKPALSEQIQNETQENTSDPATGKETTRPENSGNPGRQESKNWVTTQPPVGRQNQSREKLIPK
jgi:hypothetical protein